LIPSVCSHMGRMPLYRINCRGFSGNIRYHREKVKKIER
jgi:hypothetical protein